MDILSEFTGIVNFSKNLVTKLTPLDNTSSNLATHPTIYRPQNLHSHPHHLQFPLTRPHKNASHQSAHESMRKTFIIRRKMKTKLTKFMNRLRKKKKFTVTFNDIFIIDRVWLRLTKNRDFMTTMIKDPQAFSAHNNECQIKFSQM